MAGIATDAWARHPNYTGSPDAVFFSLKIKEFFVLHDLLELF
jgi:hypothetical protein